MFGTTPALNSSDFLHFVWRQQVPTRAWCSLRRDQPPPNPLRDLRDNGVSDSESLRKVGRIQSEAKPIIFRRSLPLNHLIPSERVSDESCAAYSDL